MNALIEQMKSHGVDVDRFPYASFCFGRGWKGHKSAQAAWKAVERSTSAAIRTNGGWYPKHGVCETATGKILGSSWMM